MLAIAICSCNDEKKTNNDNDAFRPGGQVAKAETTEAEESKTPDVALTDEVVLAGYTIGDEATDFSLMDVDGSMKSLGDYPDAKGFILTFTCNHCPYSVAYEDRLIALDGMYKEKGYPVIAINPNNPEAYPTDSYDNMIVRAQEKGFTFPYLFDDGQKIYPQYGATKTPHVFLVNKENGKNIVRYIGAIDDNYQDENKVKNHFVQDAVNALLAGEEIKTKTTKAIGCSIKA